MVNSVKHIGATTLWTRESARLTLKGSTWWPMAFGPLQTHWTGCPFSGIGTPYEKVWKDCNHTYTMKLWQL